MWTATEIQVFFFTFLVLVIRDRKNGKMSYEWPSTFYISYVLVRLWVLGFQTRWPNSWRSKDPGQWQCDHELSWLKECHTLKWYFSAFRTCNFISELLQRLFWREDLETHIFNGQNLIIKKIFFLVNCSFSTKSFPIVHKHATILNFLYTRSFKSFGVIATRFSDRVTSFCHFWFFWSLLNPFLQASTCFPNHCTETALSRSLKALLTTMLLNAMTNLHFSSQQTFLHLVSGTTHVLWSPLIFAVTSSESHLLAAFLPNFLMLDLPSAQLSVL